MNVGEGLVFLICDEYSPEKPRSPLGTHSILVFLNKVFLSNESRGTLQRSTRHQLRVAQTTVCGGWVKCSEAHREAGAVHGTCKFTFCLLPDAAEG